jgi:hypothetical protein
MDFQGSWRWCHKCQGAFFAGHPTQGVCPADKKAHDESQSGAYVTRLNAESAPPGVTSMPFFGGTLTSPLAANRAVGDGATSVKDCSSLAVPHKASALRINTLMTQARAVTMQLYSTMEPPPPSGKFIGDGVTSAKGFSLRETRRRASALRITSLTTRAKAANINWSSNRLLLY